MNMNIEEFKEHLKKQVDGFPKAGVPDWVVATPLLLQLSLLKDAGQDVGVSEEKLRFLAGAAVPPWLGESDPAKIAEMLIENAMAVFNNFDDFDVFTFAHGVIVPYANAVIPLLSDDDLVRRLEHAEGVLFDAIAYEC